MKIFPLTVVASTIAVAVSLTGCGSSSPASHATPAANSAPSSSSAPLTRAEKCENVVYGYLEQVPSALEQGYNGVTTDYLTTHYGYESIIVSAAEAAEGQVVAQISQYGHPETQITKVMTELVVPACKTGTVPEGY